MKIGEAMMRVYDALVNDEQSHDDLISMGEAETNTELLGCIRRLCDRMDELGFYTGDIRQSSWF